MKVGTEVKAGTTTGAQADSCFSARDWESLAEQFRQRIVEGNYRMMALLRENRVYYLEEESLGEAKKALENVNTMEEYKRLV